MRVSSYLIAAPLADDESYLLLHGLVGSLDKVSVETGSYLLAHRGAEVADAPWAAGDPTEVHLVERGYLTQLPERQERQLMVDVAAALHGAELASAQPNFVFVPAYSCNLRCSYCLQSHDMHAGRGRFSRVMDAKRVDDGFRVIDDANISRTTVTRIGLLGGEPLSAATREIVSYIVEQARQRGAVVWAVTNGVELDEFDGLLGAEGLAELQITLDGMASVHDRRRTGPGYRESFDRIVENIGVALATGAKVNVRINVDSANVDQLARLNELFALRGWDIHPLFTANAVPVIGQGRSPVTQKDLVALTTAMADGCVRSYESYATGVLERAFSDGYPFDRTSHCSAGMLLFDPRGDVYTCWEGIGVAGRRVGRYRGGSLKLDATPTNGRLSRFPGAVEKCSRCPYALIHTSGCANLADDRSDAVMAAACEDFDSYFPATLALQYAEFDRDGGERRLLPIVDVTGNGTTALTTP